MCAVMLIPAPPPQQKQLWRVRSPPPRAPARVRTGGLVGGAPHSWPIPRPPSRSPPPPAQPLGGNQSESRVPGSAASRPSPGPRGPGPSSPPCSESADCRPRAGRRWPRDCARPGGLWPPRRSGARPARAGPGRRAAGIGPPGSDRAWPTLASSGMRSSISSASPPGSSKRSAGVLDSTPAVCLHVLCRWAHGSCPLAQHVVGGREHGEKLSGRPAAFANGMRWAFPSWTGSLLARMFEDCCSLSQSAYTNSWEHFSSPSC